jgi:hypothetical protein
MRSNVFVEKAVVAVVTDAVDEAAGAETDDQGDVRARSSISSWMSRTEIPTSTWNSTTVRSTKAGTTGDTTEKEVRGVNKHDASRRVIAVRKITEKNLRF